MDILDSDFSYLDRRDVEGAEELFREVVARNNLGHIVPKSSPSLTLSDMGSKYCWLAPWMAKTEELWVMLTEERLWDTYYKSDDKTMSGLIVKNLEENEDKIEGVDSLLDLIENSEENTPPATLKYMVAEMAFSSSISIENGFAFLRKNDIYLKDLGNDIYLPIDYQEMSDMQAGLIFNKLKDSIIETAKQRKDIEEEYVVKKKGNTLEI